MLVLWHLYELLLQGLMPFDPDAATTAWDRDINNYSTLQNLTKKKKDAYRWCRCIIFIIQCIQVVDIDFIWCWCRFLAPCFLFARLWFTISFAMFGTFRTIAIRFWTDWAFRLLNLVKWFFTILRQFFVTLLAFGFASFYFGIACTSLFFKMLIWKERGYIWLNTVVLGAMEHYLQTTTQISFCSSAPDIQHVMQATSGIWVQSICMKISIVYVAFTWNKISLIQFTSNSDSLIVRFWACFQCGGVRDRLRDLDGVRYRCLTEKNRISLTLST